MYMVMSRERSGSLFTEEEYTPTNGSTHPIGISSASAEFKPFTNSRATVAEHFVTAAYDTCCHCHREEVVPSQPQEWPGHRTFYENARSLPVKSSQTMPSSISPASDAFLNTSLCLPEWLSSSSALHDTSTLRNGRVTFPSACQPGIENGVFDQNGENAMRSSPTIKYLSTVDDAEYYNALPSSDLDINHRGMIPSVATPLSPTRQIDNANPYLRTFGGDTDTGIAQSPFRYPEYEDVALPILEFGDNALDGHNYAQFDVQSCSFGNIPTPNILSEDAVTTSLPSASAVNHTVDNSSSRQSVTPPVPNFHPSSLYPECLFQQLSTDGMAPLEVGQSRHSEGLPMLDYPPLPELDGSSYQELQQADSCYPEPNDDGHHPWCMVEQDHNCGLPKVQPFVPASNHMTRSATRSASQTLATSRQVGSRSGQRDTSKDELLVHLKSQGMSYKQIKEIGGFGEAESTLRGRYRALTKPKEARLRKPEWGDREVIFS